MRPVSRPQSAIRYPLNHVLGTEAAVRVLRVIALSQEPIGVSELARQAQLQASGVARVCARLEDLGVIEATGRGNAARQFRRAPRSKLADELMSLFTAEASIARSIFQEIANNVRSLAPQPRAAWIQGPVAEQVDRPGDALIVGVLVEAKRASAAREQLRRLLLQVQRDFDVDVDLRVLTLADLTTLPKSELKALELVQLLLGPPPLDLIDAGSGKRAGAPGNRQSHRELDLRSLDYGVRFAELLRKDPSLRERAVQWIERRLPSASPGEQLELEEWLGLLSSWSIPRLRRLLGRDDARSLRLRQSIPFVHVLSESERKRLLRGTGK